MIIRRNRKRMIPMMVFRNSLLWTHFLKFTKLTILLLFLANVDGLEDKGQPHVFLRSEIPTQYRLHHKQSFTVLQQPLSCSNLTKCHTDWFLHDTYHLKCYEKACSKSNYFCLNDPNGNSLHLCGTPDPWGKRHRYILVRDTAVSDFVDVYSIDCPLGFFQSNEKNPFTKCDKDESIIIVKNPTDQRNALGQCNKNYCNRKGVTLFELGSENDDCLHAKYLNISCGETEDLLPNCECVPKCLTLEEREWSGNFTCTPKSENVTKSEKTKEGGERITQVTKPYRMSTGHSIHQVSEQVDPDKKRQDKELSVVDNESQNGGSAHSISTLAVIVIVVSVAAVIISVVVALVCLVKLLRRPDRDYQGIPESNCRHEDHPVEGTVQHANSVSSGSVTKEKNETVTYNDIYINSKRNIQVQFGNGHALPNNDIPPSVQNCADNHSQDSIDETRMENLKFHGNQEEDSGNASLQTTHVKRLY